LSCRLLFESLNQTNPLSARIKRLIAVASRVIINYHAVSEAVMVVLGKSRRAVKGGRPVPVLLHAETGAPLQPEDIPLCLSRFNISHTPSSMAELSSVARIAKFILLPGEAEKDGFDTHIVSHAILQSPQPPPPSEKRPAPGVILITADGDVHECPLIYTCWDAPQQQQPPPQPQQQQQ